MAYAFRCNTCNSLEGSGHAGERDIPLKCRTCGKGAHYIINDAGAPEMVPEPENWTVLADLDNNGIADILEYHAIAASEIEAHVPFVTTVVKDANGTVVTGADGAPLHTTATREGPMIEPVAPQHILVEATEEVASADVAAVV
jgi:hypothetical protein